LKFGVQLKVDECSMTVCYAIQSKVRSQDLQTWFLWSGEVREKSEDQGKSGNLKVPGCKS